MKLTQDFYLNTNVVETAKALLGKVLISNIDNHITSGIIVETEAYEAPEDSASHAYNMRRTNRNENMYAIGGTAYVYICYGMHTLFNVVTGPKETPHAILIRAIEPIEGRDIMLQRRNLGNKISPLSSGPGNVSKCLGIKKFHDGMSLVDMDSAIWIEDRQKSHDDNFDIISTFRIGVESCGKSAEWKYRFVLKNNNFISAKSFTKKFY